MTRARRIDHPGWRRPDDVEPEDPPAEQPIPEAV